LDPGVYVSGVAAGSWLADDLIGIVFLRLDVLGEHGRLDALRRTALAFAVIGRVLLLDVHTLSKVPGTLGRVLVLVIATVFVAARGDEVLPSLAFEFDEVLLGMTSNLDDSSGSDMCRDLAPVPFVQANALKEAVVLFRSPSLTLVADGVFPRVSRRGGAGVSRSRI